MTTDPFDSLQVPDEPIRPSVAFAAGLRRRLATAVGLEPAGPDGATANPETEIQLLPPRRATMTAATPTAADTTAQNTTRPSAVTPYLAVHDAAAALAFYSRAFGASEVLRVVGDDGRLGHGEFAIGATRFYLSDEFPEYGVTAPSTLGGTTVSLHLEVDDVDRVFAAAVAAGAESLADPADQPHGSRHGTLRDPFGHRWMISQTIETLSTDSYAARMAGSEWTVEGGAGAELAATSPGAIWSSVVAADAPALIRFVTEVLGFTADLVVPGAEPGVVEHSQLRWPEGGIVQVSTADRPGNVFSRRPVGGGSLYVITAEPDRVYQRCLAAGVTVVSEPASPDYDPGGSVFSVADPEGNLWSFGTYAGA
jgi:PhnB protein